jgi:hypothetical protein
MIKMDISIDFREPSDIAEELQKLGFQTNVKELKKGDYRFKWWMIERKSYSDFISSRNSKHLYVQIAEMVRYCQKHNLTPCLMVENDFNHSFEDSRIIELHCRTLGKDIWCIPTQPKGYEWSTAKTILYYAQQIMKGKMVQGIRRPQEIIGNQNNKIQILCGWPNISEGQKS